MFLHIFEILEIRRDNEMIIKYEFIDGKKIEIEVSTELGQVILQIDKETKNNDRRETRRHKSLSELSDKDDLIADESIDIEENILQKFDIDKLYDAISKLKPSKQELIHKLYLDKQVITQAAYARRKNINKAAIWKSTAYKK